MPTLRSFRHDPRHKDGDFVNQKMSEHGPVHHHHGPTGQCVSSPERKCRKGGVGSCRRCPNRHDDRSLDAKAQSLVESWLHYVRYQHGPISHVPIEFCGRPLRAAVEAQDDGVRL